MSPYPELLSLAREQNQLLRQVLGTLTRTNLVLDDLLQTTAGLLPNSGTPADASPSLCGTHRSECLHFAAMVRDLLKTGPLAIPPTPKRKPRRDLHALENSPAPLPATSSTGSTPKRAKPARIGGRSSRRSLLDAPELKKAAGRAYRETFSAKRSKKK